ncbi:MAG: alpha/beta hydrolase [Chloroflexota bacterium]|jgi:pimeloyl-ACP methyl ester carboxylesterase
MSKRGSILVIGGVLGASAGVAYAIFRRERQAILDDLRRRRQLCLTGRGVVEYATVGQGPAVLIAHGTLGGYDQGLAIARLFDQRRFTFIAVSRAGYLGSGIPTGLTCAQQADSYAALLDALGLEKAAIIGASGGGPSALQFALRHPQRCSALVLMSAIARQKPTLPPIFRAIVSMQEMLTRYDFIWWPSYRFGQRLMMRSSGLSPAEVEAVMADQQKREILAAIYRPIMTASLRRPGTLIDHLQIEELAADFVDQISRPTLVAHSKNDPLAPFADAQWLAENIPGAAFLPVDDGGHVFFIAHREQVIPKITSFLETHAD